MSEDTPPPQGEDVPPPARPPTVSAGLKPAAEIAGGLILGIAAGFALPLLVCAGVTLGLDMEPTLPGLWTCVAIFVAVPLAWRCGLRGVPIGLCIGVALPTLLFAYIAFDGELPAGLGAWR